MPDFAFQKVQNFRIVGSVFVHVFMPTSRVVTQ